MLFTQLLTLTLVLLLMFCINRGTVRQYLNSILRKRSRKRLARDQSFSEWFFYKRYIDILPKFVLVGYYLQFIVYIVLFIVTIVLNILSVGKIANDLIWAYFVCEALFMITISFIGK